MISSELEARYENVVLVQVVEIVDGLLRRHSETRVNSIILTQGWLDRPRLMELKGLGKDVWQTEDAQIYVNRLREQWRR